MIDLDEYLKNFYKGNRVQSLEVMEYFMNKYDNFEKNMKFIHIAGTNGKGSVTEIISNILEKQGYKVGKFLSPHLINYNERISINKKEISNEEMISLIEELEPLINKYYEEKNNKVSLFELITMMALLYFYRNNVDFVVLETGLGGLKDSTNIITKPLVSIITSIGYDHMQILGDTIEEIALEKAGIIKENSNTVIFKSGKEVDNVFINECKKKNNKLHIVDDLDVSNYSYDENLQYFDYKNIKNLSINLKGKIQIKNALLCIESIKIINELGYKVDIESIKKGLSTVIHKGRMEKLLDKPLIVYDGAHNEPAMNNLYDMVKMYYKNYKRIYIVSILKRKDYKTMLKLLSRDDNALFIVTSGDNSERYVSSEELYSIMENYVPNEKISKKTLEEAIEYVLKESEDSKNIVNLFVGSFYVYGIVVNKLKKN